MKLKIWFGILVAFLIPAVAGAHSIGVHFVGKDASSSTLAKADKAGVVPQKHWNNLTIDSSDPNGHSNGGTLYKLTNDNGKAIKGASASVTAMAGHGIWAGDGASWGFSGANLTLQKGTIGPCPQITIKGIPYARYDVYVYATAGVNGGLAKIHISRAVGSTGSVDHTSTYFCNYNWQGGNFVVSKATTLAAAKTSKGSNYVVFKGNTAKSITLRCNGALASWIGFSGVQIVDAAHGRK